MFKGFIFTRRITSRTLLSLLSLTSLSLLASTKSTYAQEANIVDQSNFKVRLINMEGPSTEVFRYSATLANRTNKEKIFELQSSLPPGWSIAYKTDGVQVTSVNLEPNSNREISIEITPSYTADVKKHIIPVKAISNADTTVINLESVIKGAYKLEVTTQNQILSGGVTTGGSKEIFITVKNSGTLPLEKIELQSQLPSKWESSFDITNIDKLDPGKTKDIKVNIKVPDKTIAGDYMINISAKNNNQTASVDYRMEVKTSLLTGWIGILLIAIAIGFVYFLIRKYGRR